MKIKIFLFVMSFIVYAQANNWPAQERKMWEIKAKQMNHEGNKNNKTKR